MVESANFVVVVADSSKVGREEFVSFAGIDSLDVLVTDSQITDSDRTELTRGGLEVLVAQAIS
jgi:DeoR family fructose operon transcriptional repressor